MSCNMQNAIHADACIMVPYETEYRYWNEECIHLGNTRIWYDKETMRCALCEGWVPPKYRRRR
jgi:hypothetical protein